VSLEVKEEFSVFSDWMNLNISRYLGAKGVRVSASKFVLKTTEYFA